MAIFKYGKIAKADPAKGMYTVEIDEDGIQTKMIPVLTNNSKGTKFESPLKVGEHVSVLMDDQFEDGVVLGAIYSDKDKPANGAGENVWRTTFEDGSFIKFDKSKGEFTVSTKGDVKVVAAKNVDVQTTAKVVVNAAAAVEVTAPQVTITGNVAITGALSVTGAISMGGAATVAGALTVAGNVTGADVLAGPISLTNHKHPDTTSGGTTGPSIP